MKIKNKNLDKILENATSNEIDLILYLAQFQDLQGKIKGINYLDVCTSLDIPTSTFYTSLNGLAIKNIISIDYNNTDYSFFTLIINDNSFIGEVSFKNYTNINYTLLHSKQFKELSRGEKVIILKLFQLNFGRYYIKINIDTLMTWTRRTKQSVMLYLKNLKGILELSRNKDTITFVANVEFNARPGDVDKNETEQKIYNRHLLKYLTKKNKFLAEPGEQEEVLKLFKQYRKLSPQILWEVIEKATQQIGNLQVKYIHRYLRNYLNATNLAY